MKPVEIRGTWFPSMAAAADAHGVTRSTVCNAAAIGRLDTVGIGPGRISSKPKQVVYKGKSFPSVKAAAEYYGMHYNTMYYKIYKKRR